MYSKMIMHLNQYANDICCQLREVTSRPPKKHYVQHPADYGYVEHPKKNGYVDRSDNYVEPKNDYIQYLDYGYVQPPRRDYIVPFMCHTRVAATSPDINSPSTV